MLSLSIISAVIVGRSYSGFQPHSSLAIESSIDSGQESAMVCLKSGLYLQMNSGRCFCISLESSSAVKLIAVMLKSQWCLSDLISASMRSMVPLMQSGMYIIGSLVSLLTKQVYLLCWSAS